MNSHESAGEERTGGFEGRVGGAELGDSQQVGVRVLKGGMRQGGVRGGAATAFLWRESMATATARRITTERR